MNQLSHLPFHFFAFGRFVLSRSTWLWPLLGVLGALADGAAAPAAPLAPPQGEQLLKTDILAVFAHPDDETGMAATLAFYAKGKQSVVANVYCTRGEGGGNMVGTQAGAALGTLREVELRDGLTILGVRHCFFLDQLDWAYTESLAATLEKWGKESTLEKLVRLVRALRPEVMLTMNPAPTPGQHGHHQAAGVLATEAFTAAANPQRFPLQLTKEGLSVWQPRKLYYSGSSTGRVATIEVTHSIAGGKSPAQLAAEALVNHRSQAFGNFGGSPWLQRPQRFTLVKSFVQVPPAETDLLDGAPWLLADRAEPLPLAPPTRPPALQMDFVSRPAFRRYRQWVAEQGIQHVAAQFVADCPVVAGERNALQLQLVNSSDSMNKGALTLQTPASWQFEPGAIAVQVAPHSTGYATFHILPPEQAGSDIEIAAKLDTPSGVFRTTAKVHPLPKMRVPKLRLPPALDGTERGWEKVGLFTIPETNLVQGRANGPADSSAQFRLAHCARTLFVDVLVRDDVLATNIAPNDIKGHWRSDSIEICLDPNAGSEHTMACYKLGVFPFDTTGTVRGARDADANQGPIEETAPRTRLSSQRTPDGYRIQAAIPFDEIGLARNVRRLGFNLIIYDGDKQPAALGENINESRIAWAARPGVMGRPEDWGRLELE